MKMENEVAGFALDTNATGLVNPNFAEYARACGVIGIRVEHAAGIEPAIRKGLMTSKPVILEAMVTPGELAYR